MKKSVAMTERMNQQNSRLKQTGQQNSILSSESVSYTHLDVYKRQALKRRRSRRRRYLYTLLYRLEYFDDVK